MWRGLLVDRLDLSASLDVKRDDVEFGSDRLSVTARVSSPPPHRLKVLSSTDPGTFIEDASAEVTATEDPRVSNVSASSAGENRKFVQVTAEVWPQA